VPGEKRDVLDMLAEFLRELAVLVLVFVPLEAYLQHRLSKRGIATIFGLAFILLTFRIVLERRR